MKIVLLQDDFPPESVGGAGNIAATLALALKELGRDVVVLAATQIRERAGISDWQGIPVHRIYSAYHERWRAYRSLYSPYMASEVRRLLKELGPDVVHVHNVHMHLSYYALVLAKRHAKRVVLTAHDEMLFHYGKFYECVGRKDYKVHWWQIAKRFTKRWNPFRNMVIRRCMRGVEIVSVSQAIADALADNGYASAVVHNGIDPNAWNAPAPEVEAFKQAYGLAGKRVIGFGGRLSNLKGGFLAIRMLEQVLKQKPDAALLVLGRKDWYAQEMEREAGRRGIGGSLHFAGWLSGSELVSATAAAEIVVTPSVYLDPFPTVNLEAMAAEKPVVATCFGGSKEAVSDGETGYVIDPRDTQAFAQRVLELLQDPAKARRLGQAGRAKLLERFTARRMAEEYVGMYTA